MESYASSNGIPWVRFGKDDRKIAIMQPHIEAQAATGRSGVAAVGVSQEFQRGWTAYQRAPQTGAPQYTFAKAYRRVNFYKFYFWDEHTREVRWMCAWDTREEDVDAFAEAIAEVVGASSMRPI